MFDLTGKVAIVTGSTSGIGTGIAECFAEAGAQVIVTGRRKEKGEAVVEALRENGGKAEYHFLDIMDEKAIEDLMKDVSEKYGKIDILVNNAADALAPNHGVLETTAEDWDYMMSSALKSVFLVTKAVIPYMQKNGGGSIINTGSTAALAGNLSYAAYGPAKVGVENFTKNVAYQFGKDNIRCNCIRPGLTVTAENEPYIPQAFKDIYMDEIEVNRWGNPRDIGYMATFFASDEAGYVTSQIISVDGGMWSHAPQNSACRKMGFNF